MLPQAQIGKVEALLTRVNPKAELLRTTHSQLDPGLLLGKARFQMAKAAEHPEWLKEAREHEHTPETVEFGISSFVFRSQLPFHPERLHAALASRPRAGALDSLLRLKGFCWIATWGSRRGVAALAGTQFALSPGQPWWASVKREHWPEGLSDEIKKEWTKYGDRRTELVCIGLELEQAAAQAELEKCVLTESELEAGPAAWFSFKDPFYEAWEKKNHAHAEVTHVLVLHENDEVPMQEPLGVMAKAGVAGNMALPLLARVSEYGQGRVAQGKEADMKILAGCFAEIGMETTIQSLSDALDEKLDE